MPSCGYCKAFNLPIVKAAEQAQETSLAALFAGYDLVPPKVLAARTGISGRTWERRRSDGSGPPFIHIGAAVRYPSDTLREWIRANAVKSTSAATVAASAAVK